jgi:DNA-binding beta-propeller fold protein YncE
MNRDRRCGLAGGAIPPAGPVFRGASLQPESFRRNRSRPRCSVLYPLTGLLLAWSASGCDAPRRVGAAGSAADKFGKTAPAAVPVTKAVDMPRVGTGAQTYEHQGVRVAFEILPTRAAGPASSPAEFREGQDAAFRITITDATSGAGVAKAHPAAWLLPRTEGEGREAIDAAKAIAKQLRGDRFSRPTLDLNLFYALTMNDDATVTVIDPLLGVGNSKLLSMVRLQGNAIDWALSDDLTRLYIASPSSDQVTVVDTASWTDVAVLEKLGRPTRLALQPDGHYLWATYEDASGSGIAAIDTVRASVAGKVLTGRGTHEIAFDARGRFAFATNSEQGTVSAVEIRSLRKVADIPTGPTPRSIAYSNASQMVYVTDETNGSVTIISPDDLKVVGRAAAEPGVTQVRFTPDGKLGLALNPKANTVHVLDAALGRVVQSAGTEANPDQVVFAGGLAYVRHLDTPNVRIIPPEGLGVEGRPITVIDFPAGQNIPSARKPEPSHADSIAAVPGDDAVLVANPSDRTVYYYKQGMSAPIGSFSNYGRIPRAVLTLDRSLRERTPGVYETVGRLGPAGDYNLAFLLDTPRITHYFSLKVAHDPERAKRVAAALVVQPLNVPSPTAGTPSTLRFQITNRATGIPAPGLSDVCVLAFSPGGWQRRLAAKAVAEEPGVYVAEWTPPRGGTYYFYAEAPSAGVKINRNWFLTATTKDLHP